MRLSWGPRFARRSRTNLPIYIRNAAGQYERAAKASPGTVLFAGYDSTLANPADDPRPASLRRTRDGFFLKLSYLFRL